MFILPALRAPLVLVMLLINTAHWVSLLSDPITVVNAKMKTCLAAACTETADTVIEPSPIPASDITFTSTAPGSYMGCH